MLKRLIHGRNSNTQRGAGLGSDGSSMNDDPLHLGFLSPHSPFDRRGFSGSPYYMYQALASHPRIGSMRVLGQHPKAVPSPVERLRAQFSTRSANMPHFSKADFRTDDLDVIVAPVAGKILGTHGGQFSTPIILVLDATPGILAAHYGEDMRAVIPREQAALRQAAHVVYSSREIATLALTEFPFLTPQKVSVAPFGVNLDHLPEATQPKPAPAPIRLTFIGTNWQRKGGDIALAIQATLRAQGQNSELTLVGAAPPDDHLPPDVTHHPFLDKNRPADMARLDDILRQTHLLILPTRADCTPMVIAEANVYGCPVLASAVGGIGTLIADGINGYLMDPAAPPADWAARIAGLAAVPEAFAALSQTSNAHARANLSWTNWADSLLAVADRVRRTDPAV